MVGGHERDGRSWKAEWIALPEVCQLTAVALRLARSLLDGLEVHPEAMAAAVERFGGLGSERVLAGLTTRLGRYQAQQALHEVLRDEGTTVVDLPNALARRGLATAEEVRGWGASAGVETAARMADGVLSRSHAAREAEPESWR
jgi:adenylosuccinate lyase